MIRNSAKGIVVHEGKILLVISKAPSDEWTTLPGGGQDKFETLSDALIRECLEETGYEIQVDDIVFIREYMGKNHEFSETDHELHQIEYMFSCSLSSNTPKVDYVAKHDKEQVGITWVHPDDLDKANLYPVALRNKIKDLLNSKKSKIYLGDVN